LQHKERSAVQKLVISHDADISPIDAMKDSKAGPSGLCGCR
jgi:hypothetical protein